MSRFVIGVSLAHLFLFPAYVKLGAIQPWQAVGSIFGEGPLWWVLMGSAIVAPFLLAGIGLALYSLLRPQRIRESLLILLGVGGLLSLVNGLLIANRQVEQNIHIPLIAFIGQHLFLLTYSSLIVLILSSFLLLYFPPLREKLATFGKGLLYALTPLAALSMAGLFYVLLFASALEESEGSITSSPEHLQPQTIVILLFDALSYNAVFTEEQEVDDRLPNLSALAEQSLVFHNVHSLPGGTGRNIPIILTGQVYPEKGIVLDGQGEEVVYQPDGTKLLISSQRNLFDVAYENGYPLTVFGYAMRYCSIYVDGKGYCRSTAPSEFSTQPDNFAQAFSEVYRLAIVRALPTTLEYRLQILLGTSALSATGRRTLDLQDSLLPRLERPGFFYVHYPIPHVPYISLDPQTREITGSSTYFDSVQAVDFFLGEVRERLTDLGMWEETLLVVLADHNDGYVTDDPRTPLIIKLPNKQDRINYDYQWTHEQFLPLLEWIMERKNNES